MSKVGIGHRHSLISKLSLCPMVDFIAAFPVRVDELYTLENIWTVENIPRPHTSRNFSVTLQHSDTKTT